MKIIRLGLLLIIFLIVIGSVFYTIVDGQEGTYIIPGLPYKNYPEPGPNLLEEAVKAQKDKENIINQLVLERNKPESEVIVPNHVIRKSINNKIVIIYDLDSQVASPQLTEPTPVVVLEQPDYDSLIRQAQLFNIAHEKWIKAAALNNNKAAEMGRLRDLLDKVFTATSLEDLKMEIQAVISTLKTQELR